MSSLHIQQLCSHISSITIQMISVCIHIILNSTILISLSLRLLFLSFLVKLILSDIINLMNIKSYIIAFSLLAHLSQSICSHPQKSIYISLNSLANSDHIENLFKNISEQTSSYSLAYID